MILRILDHHDDDEKNKMRRIVTIVKILPRGIVPWTIIIILIIDTMRTDDKNLGILLIILPLLLIEILRMMKSSD